MLDRIRPYGPLAVRMFAVRSPQERRQRAAHAVALLLVSAAALAGSVTGATLHPVPFTLFPVAIAASAAYGGFAPGVVATLGAILAVGIAGPAPVDLLTRVLMGAEGVMVAVVVSMIRSRLIEAEGRLEVAGATVADLRIRDRHGRLLDAALQHLEDTATEMAVAVLNDRGVITEWRSSAERLYGHSAADIVGTPVAALFEGDWNGMMRAAAETGSLRQSAVHRRRDGTRVHVELELRPLPEADAHGFTLAVKDLAQRLEWNDYRDAATRAQAALQQAVDDGQQQLAALESLTDPELNPLAGPAMVTELLDRLRAMVGADGAALVTSGPVGAGLVAVSGLQPFGSALGSAEGPPPTPGRVALVHNDPARVQQLSALRWPADVTSLMVVPVVHNGRVWSALEVVSERSRRASDWDVALARIVADRLAAVVVQNRWLPAKVS